MKKFKFLSLVLCFILLISALTPVNAYASETYSVKRCSIYFHHKDDNFIERSLNQDIPTIFTATELTNSNLGLVDVLCSFPADIKKNSHVTIQLQSIKNSKYVSWASMRIVYGEISSTNIITSNHSYDRANGLYTFEFECPFAISQTDKFYLEFELPTYTSNLSGNMASFNIRGITVEVEDENTSVLKNVLNSLKSWFNSLFEWLSNIRENISDGFSNIGNWFSELGSKIKGFFENLTDSISTFFTNLTNKLKTWFDNVGTWFSELGTKIKGFFVDIGDRISGFFEKLWNRIWWGNENGESEYVKPVIDNKLNDIIEKLQEYQQSLQDTIATIHSSAEEVSEYIKTGTSLVNGVIGVAGAGFTALIVFGIVFVLVRKVVGR